MHLSSAISAFAHLAAAVSLGGVVVLTNSIHLVERRGRKGSLDPKRQLEISTLLDSVPEAAVLVDSSERIVDANLAAGQLVGKTVEEMRGMAAEDFGRLLEPVSTADPPTPLLRRALAGNTIRHERLIVRDRKTGAVTELMISASPIVGDDGRPIAALLIARDVTELTQLQRRVGDVERHRAIGEMAAALTHDFNNILQTISQAATVLEMQVDRPAADRKPLLEMIQNTVRGGAEMVQRIREYLKTGSGALRLVDLRTIINEAVELTRPLWLKSNVKISRRLTPVPHINGNSADLRRVFTNLILNAIEAMPTGGEITVACEPRDHQVVTTVSDTGVGIRPEDQAKVFFAYFTTKPRGMGLGLSGAQKTLLSYGGNISLRSEVGKGTTFTIVLPAANGQTKVA